MAESASLIYLDSAATSLLKPPAVGQAMVQALRGCASPGRGGHGPARAAAQVMYNCRELLGRLFDARPEQVIFTSNATHGLNIAIRTLVPMGGRVVISGFEHNAVTRPLFALGAQTVVAGTKLFDPKDTLSAWAEALTTKPCAAVCTHVSNAFGYVLPIDEIAVLCRRYGVPLIIDASQSAGVLPLSLERTGARFIAMPGHKGLLGPQGTGVLICGQNAAPMFMGGTGSESISQSMPDYLPDRLEAGTHNVCGIAGLTAGVRHVMKLTPERIFAHEVGLLKLLRERFAEIKRIRPFTGTEQSGVVSFTVEGEDCEAAANQLAARGIALRAGLHCAPLAHKSAGTLPAGTLRVSFSPFNTQSQVLQFVAICGKVFSGQ